MDVNKLDRYVREYIRTYKRYRADEWCYEDGCIYMGAKCLFEATKDPFYYEFLIKNVGEFVMEDGTIRGYDKEAYNIDNINAGKILFFLYESTGEEKYRRAIELLMDQLRTHPRASCGNFWHKKIYPNQIWLDGLYMAQPFYMEYETKYDKKENYNDIVHQFKNVRQYLFSEEKQLYYHAYDETRTRIWANKETGCSPNFWLRSMGWYLMSLIDTYEKTSEEIYEHYNTYKVLFREAIKGILNYQDPASGLFYQLIDLAEVDGNYLETSGSIMISYAIMKGCRLGVLQAEKYQAIGEGILSSIIDKRIEDKDGRNHLTQICAVAGLGPNEERDGSVAYYLSEPIKEDDQKAVGPLMMAFSEYLRSMY
jgi:unsaturated rhamnogalacturonyl hydrolase